MTDVAPPSTVRSAVARLRPPVRAAWRVGGPAQRAIIVALVVVAVALAGAFLFGVWHVFFGGLVKGNWRAGGFGVVLAIVSGGLLWIESVVVRRRS
jgi:membrane protein YdbS with pleckstrin-like domain